MHIFDNLFHERLLPFETKNYENLEDWDKYEKKMLRMFLEDQ